jgi:hypothetical protein
MAGQPIACARPEEFAFMPLEARPGNQFAQPTSIGQAYLAEARSTLQSSLGKITHCLDQLRHEDLE